MKHSFEQLLHDLKPAMKAWLIAIHKSDTMITIRLRKGTAPRAALTEYINKHYNVTAQLHGTFSIHVHRKD